MIKVWGKRQRWCKLRLVDPSLEIENKRELGVGLIDQSLEKKIKMMWARIDRSESGEKDKDDEG